VENGHTIPSLETLEKWARALNVPLYQVFYWAERSRTERPQPAKNGGSSLWGSTGRDARFLDQLRRTLSQTRESDRKLLLQMARKLAKPAA